MKIFRRSLTEHWPHLTTFLQAVPHEDAARIVDVLSISFLWCDTAFSPGGGCMFLLDGVHGWNTEHFIPCAAVWRFPLESDGRRAGLCCSSVSQNLFGEDELFGLHALFFAVSSNHFVHSFGRARCKIVVSDILAFRSTA